MLDAESREQILDLVHAYAQALDSRQPERVAALFTPDCSFRVFAGDHGQALGREAVEALVGRLLKGLAATSHRISNTVLTPPNDGDDGVDGVDGVSYVYAWHRFADVRPDGHLWGRYLDRFVPHGEGWRIARRELQVAAHRHIDLPWISASP